MTEDPSKVVPTSEVEQLRSTLRVLALSHPESFYHEASGTHIFYQPWLSPFGVRGVGDFADEAHLNLCQKVDAILLKASASDLIRWKQRADEHTQSEPQLDPYPPVTVRERFRVWPPEVTNADTSLDRIATNTLAEVLRELHPPLTSEDREHLRQVLKARLKERLAKDPPHET